MSTRHEDSEHVLVVEIEDGKPIYHLEHTTDCPFVEDDLGGIPMITHTCMTGAFWNDAGSDSLSEKPEEPGRYRVQAWYQGPGWAGSYPIEPEGWIDVLEAVPPVSGEGQPDGGGARRLVSVNHADAATDIVGKSAICPDCGNALLVDGGGAK